MKLSELRVCDNCSKALIERQNITFYVIDVDMAVIIPQQVNSVLGLTQMFGGSLRLAETMGAYDSPIKLIGEQPESPGKTRILLCQNCYCKSIHIASLAEQVVKEKEQRETKENG